FWMVTLKAHILPHHDLQPPGCRGSCHVPRLRSGQRLCDPLQAGHGGEYPFFRSARMMLVWPDFHMAGTTLCLKISDVTLHKIKIYHHEQ
ncbi:hypothetical protein ACI7VB_005421, partial [Escherichia coli]